MCLATGRSSPGRPSAARRRRPQRRAAPRTPVRRGPAAGHRTAATCAAGCRSGSFSARLGNSLTPVIGSLRVAIRAARASHAAASRSRTRPSSQRRESAGPLDLGEPVPGRLREPVGQRLDVPGATGRVEHAGEVALLDQQVLGVARDPAGERVGQAQRGVERLHGHDVGAAHAGGEAGHRRAQHVDPRVAPGRHDRGGDRVLALRADVRGRAAGLADPVPSRRAARSPAMVVNWSALAAVAELQRGERLVDRQPAVGERPQVGHARPRASSPAPPPRSAPASAKTVASTTTVAQARRGRPRGGRRRRDRTGPAALPLAACTAERVQAERAAGGEVGAALDQREERLGGRQPALDGHRREVEQDVGEDVAERVDRDRALADAPATAR